MKEQTAEPPERLGRYELLGSLGSGGMGDVHRARAYGAAGTVKELCIKRIRASRLTDAHAVDRFVTEARLSMRLSHGNIVPVFDFGRADGQYFLAMEWVDGADLRALLRPGPLTPCVAAHVAAEVARALAYAHGLDEAEGGPLIHRDVKPGNVLVSTSGDVKLVDFGVAVTGWAGADGRAGTVAYMSPEQERGAAVDPRADLFSLGVVLAEMLGLGRPKEPALVSPQCPSELFELLRRLLAPDARDRPTDARGVASELESFVAMARIGGDRAPRDVLAERVQSRKSTLRAVEERLVLSTELSFLRDGECVNADSLFEPTRSTAAETPGDQGEVDSPSRSATTSGSRRLLWTAVAILLLLTSAALRLGWGSRDDANAASPAEHEQREARVTPPEEVAPPRATEQPEGASPRAEAAERMPATENATAADSAHATASTASRAPQEVTERAPHPRSRARAQAGATSLLAELHDSPADAGAREVPSRPGHLDINATPWARVYLDGRDLGTTPLFDVTVPAGPHRLRFVNAPLSTTREVPVDVAAAGHRRVVVDLSASPSAARPGTSRMTPVASSE